MKVQDQIKALADQVAALTAAVIPSPKASAAAESFATVARQAVKPQTTTATAKAPLPLIITVERTEYGLTMHVHNGRTKFAYFGRYLNARVLERVFSAEGRAAASKVLGRTV